MANHEVTAAGYFEREGDYFTSRPDSTLGAIIVETPVRPGERFSDAVLGVDRSGVSIQEVSSTPDTSIFLAESSIGKSTEARRASLNVIAERTEERRASLNVIAERVGN